MTNVVILRSNTVDPDPRVEKIAWWLSQSGYKVTILGWDREKISRRKEVRQGYLIIRYQKRATYGGGLKNLLKFLMFNLWIGWELLFLNFDVVHACDFDTVIPAWLVARLKRKKVVFDIFDLHSEAHFGSSKGLVRRILQSMESFFINHSDAVIIVDDSRREQIRGTRPRRLEVIYNVPDTSLVEEVNSFEKVESKEDSMKRRLKIGYVGALQRGRMLIELLDLVGKSKDFELFIAGFGLLEGDVKKVSQEHHNIHFFGKVSYEEALRIYSKCDVIFAVYDPDVPNHRYSSPNKVFEAMALGKPIIVAEGTGVDQLVRSANLGFVVRYGDVRHLAEVFNKIKQMSLDELKSMRERAVELFRTKYSPQLMRHRLLSVYSNLLAQRRDE
ncbi:MAG: Glycosyltransferase [Thermotoga petrophila]|uniref:Glycosyltransferase n=1 Tax=Thermotoga petrophila TaxID=93929 RepID=A0A124FFV3_9THEM|nr:MAG: Glycosyltransferase [Thermotoga petrophila]